MPKYEYSQYQKDIFNDVANGKGNSIIEAFAGSGKTTVLLESFKFVPKGKKILAVAFNTKIAKELKERAPEYSNLEISTLHSLGFKAVREKFKSKLDPNKSFRIIQTILKADGKEREYETIFNIKKAVSLCKAYIIDAPSKVDELIDKFGIDTIDYTREEFIEKIILTLSECKRQTKTVDYDDMVYFAICFNLPVGQYDYVFVDEYQDLNASQIHLALSAKKLDGRIIFYGDIFQRVYAFKGADEEVIGGLPKKINARIFPLPISYRCPNKVIYEAQRIVPGIKAAVNAKNGDVINIEEKELKSIIKPGDFLLSRTNAPLIKWCMKFVKDGIKANIPNKDVGVQLTYLIKQSNKKTVKNFLTWLDDWKQKEIDRLRSKNRSTFIVQDKVECLNALCEDAKSLDDVKQNIKEFFNDDDYNTIICYTIHGAKGLECNNVFILKNSFRMYGSEEEEKNIEYVSITRSKDKLYYVR